MTALPLFVADMLAQACRTEALNVGVPMAVAVVDAEGGLLSFARMDGTLPVSTELAASKAYTAAVLRMATHELGRLAQPGGELYGIEAGHGGKIVLFGGGFPLRVNGKVVGAVGVSGGSVQQDMRVAESAVDLMSAIDQWRENIIRVNISRNTTRFPIETVVHEIEKELTSLFPDKVPSKLFGGLLGGVALVLE
jgi:uncharacterized protein GlcG (DUF336 family)